MGSANVTIKAYNDSGKLCNSMSKVLDDEKCKRVLKVLTDTEMDYEELVEELGKQPKTRLPGLVTEILKVCHKNNVFKNNDPVPFVKRFKYND